MTDTDVEAEVGIEYRSFEPDLEVRSAGDGRTVIGIAVPYNRAQRIDNQLTEEFVPGVFAHQVRAAHRVPLTAGHLDLGGALIGKTMMLREDPAGLYGEWRVSKTARGDETLELLRDGVLSHLSIGFREDRNRRTAEGVTQRTRAHLREVAVVPEGAYGDKAAVKAVREVTVDPVGTCRLEQARRLLAALPVLPPLTGFGTDTLIRSQSNLDNTPNGRKLWDYYLRDPVGAKWAGSPHPWTALRDALLKNAKGELTPEQAEGLAANIFHAKFGMWPGEREGHNPAGRG